jgi:DNA-binding GntR family transcriptional regulator
MCPRFFIKHVCVVRSDDALLWAKLEHRLQEGAVSGETLAKITGASRSRIRQVISRLAHEYLATLMPHRQALAARSSLKKAL